MANITSDNTEIPFEIPNIDSIVESFHSGTNYTADVWGTTESPETVRPGSEAIIEAYADASIRNTEMHKDEAEQSFPIDIEDGMEHGVQLDEQLRSLISETGQQLYVIAQVSAQSNQPGIALRKMESSGLDVGVYAGRDAYSEEEHRRVGTYDAKTGEIQLDDPIGDVAAVLEPR